MRVLGILSCRDTFSTTISMIRDYEMGSNRGCWRITLLHPLFGNNPLYSLSSHSHCRKAKRLFNPLLQTSDVENPDRVHEPRANCFTDKKRYLDAFFTDKFRHGILVTHVLRENAIAYTFPALVHKHNRFFLPRSPKGWTIY